MAEKSKASALAGAALSWFLLLPSLGLVQKYLGTTAALGYFTLGSLLLIALSVRHPAVSRAVDMMDRRWALWTMTALFAGLALAFMVLSPVTNSAVAGLSAPHLVGGGSDRAESLNLGVREFIAGRYPYYQMTQLANFVTQMPGSLLLALPFFLLGNAAWQNLFWFGVFFGVVRYLFVDPRPALGFVALILFGCPVVLQDFLGGSDLGANAVMVLAAVLLILTLAADTSIAGWKKVAAAALAGIVFSSRMNYLLLLPLLFAGVARRAGRKDAITYLSVLGLVFTAVTLPFYWHDPAGFAPLHLHNRFSQFGEVPNSGVLFPTLSFLFSVILSCLPANRALHVWLIQCGLALTLPVVFLVALSTLRWGWPNFAYADYGLSGVFFGGLGAGLRVLRSESIETIALAEGR